MNLEIGYTLDDERTLDKDFHITKSTTGVIKGDCDILNPTFIIEKPDNMNINYCYCEEFGRYYYISPPTILTGNRLMLECSVDFLNSFKDGIKNLSVIVDKQQGDASNMYLDDGSFVTLNKKYNEVKRFPNGFNENGTYILICAGGEVPVERSGNE